MLSVNLDLIERETPNGKEQHHNCMQSLEEDEARLLKLGDIVLTLWKLL